MSDDSDQPQGDLVDTAPQGADEMPQGSDTETPEVPVDPDWKAQARKWEGRAKKSDQQLAELRKKLEQMVSPEAVADKDTQLADALAQAKQAELIALRYKVAADKGLPADLMDFLTGDTEEELSEKADKLTSMLPKAVKAQAASAGINSEPPPPDKPNTAELLRIIARGR